MDNIDNMDNIEENKEIFKKDNIICIKNILDKNLANNIYKIISNKIFNKLWYLTIHDGETKYIFPYRHNKNISGILNKLKKNKKRGIFTYYIYRTFQIPNYLYIDKLKKILISYKFINTIKEISGENINKLNEIFISMYDKNCFLDIHEDQNKGKIAFVIYLTKDWKIDYGGNLHFINDDEIIKKSYKPSFNTLILFKVSSKSKHFVSSINSYIQNKRYCITGWYK